MKCLKVGGLCPPPFMKSGGATAPPSPTPLGSDLQKKTVLHSCR